MRILLFTGKGGVGKTTVAAATALRMAELGYRTLAISTDAAHSLADSLGAQLGNSPTELDENLWAQELDILEEMSANWSTIHTYVAAVIKSRGVDDIISEEMAVLPGMDELFGLLQIHRANRSGAYDCLVVDCAPTGQTLRLLSLPDVTRWWMEKIFPVERMIAKTVRPVMKSFLSFPIPTDEFYASVQKFFLEVGALKELLMDPQKTSIRLVLNPEKMVIEETQRAYTYLGLYGYPVDCVIANRILPDPVTDPYFQEWHKIQLKYLNATRIAFAPLPILEARLMRSEVLGRQLLRQLVDDLYGDGNPADIYCEERPQRIVKEGEDYSLILKLPFTKKSDLEVTQKADQLIIQVGSYRREIFLPKALALRDLQSARFEDGELRFTFGGGE